VAQGSPTGTRRPEEMGFDSSRWSRVRELAQDAANAGNSRLAIAVAGRGTTLDPIFVQGERAAPSARPLDAESVFLVASLTKPIVAMAALLLVERGRLTLNDRVADMLPLKDSSKKSLTLRHLLTHTSGLPDMLPGNRELRMARSPFEAFYEGTLQAAMDFPPGRGVQYQSMGFVLLDRIIADAAGVPTARFIQEEIFEPCGMTDSILGAPDGWFDGGSPRLDRIVPVQVPPEQVGGDEWNWNSRYWRQFGAAWGGLLSTPADLARFCLMMLSRGSVAGRTLFSPATIAAATTNQLGAFPDVPEADRRCRGWGLGWRMQWPAHAASFGDLLSPEAYGHWGATGTVFWIDPQLDLAAVILTDTPLDHSTRWIVRLSNAIAAARLESAR